jgi:predicted MFS family arabinose efflux permease
MPRTSTKGRDIVTALAARSIAPHLRDTTPLRAWLAVAAISLAVFALMTTEMLPVGLLTPMGAGLGVSEGAAGLTVTVPGLAAAAAAPILTVLTGRLDRRLVLIALAALVAVANVATALADGFAVVLAVRVLVGVSIGGFWSIAGGVALRLVAARHVPRATAVVYGGIGAATVLGVPAGTVVGDLAGWRAAFWAVGALAVLALGGVVALVPRLPSGRARGGPRGAPRPPPRPRRPRGGAGGPPPRPPAPRGAAGGAPRAGGGRGGASDF